MGFKKKWLAILMAACALAAALALAACGESAPSSTAQSEESAAEMADGYFASWEDDSPTVKLVRDYVADVTDESSANFIPEEARVVTIDFDGTLFGELDPIYFDWAIVVHRVLWDSTFTPTEEQVEVAHTIEGVEQTRVFPADYDIAHASTLAKIFEGMTQDEIIAYAQEFAETDAPKFKGMKRKDSYFVPMRELVTFLEDNGFTCYIVSGTDRTLLRALVPYAYPEIPLSHIIGSPTTMVAEGQGSEDGLEYTLGEGEEVVSSGELVYKDLKMNKVSAIAQEIGVQPVISLGNSSGDSSMAEYAKNNEYKSLSLMLLCDDTERDWGEVDKAAAMKESCEKNGWHAVSERDEWKTIYGEGVEIDKNWEWTSEIAGPNQKSAEESEQPEQPEQASVGITVEQVKERGSLLVGATGDYCPLSMRESDGTYWGLDAELAQDLADDLGVKLQFVETTWPTILQDTVDGKFDLALCGVSRTDARLEAALMSNPYLPNGKTVLMRAEDVGKYTSLDDINQPGVRVMENPGGTNEKLAREWLPNAAITIHEANAEIPGLIASGEADVMITEMCEAGYYASKDPRLAAPLIDQPFSRGEIGALTNSDSGDLLAYVNDFLSREEQSGRLDELQNTYIYGDAALDQAA